MPSSLALPLIFLLVLSCGLGYIPFRVVPKSLFRHLSMLNTVNIERALGILDNYDKDYIARMKVVRASGISPKTAEFKRAQELTSTGIQAERDLLQFGIIQFFDKNQMHYWTAALTSSALKVMSEEAVEVVLGIKAETGVKSLEVLRQWVGTLNLPRGKIRAGFL